MTSASLPVSRNRATGTDDRDNIPKVPKDRSPRFLIALLLTLVLTNVWWAGPQGGSPQHWDSATHLSESLAANRVFESEGGVSFKSLLDVSWYYPPFVSYIAVPFYRVFGESEFTGSLVMSFFLVVLILSVYALGMRLYDSRTGLLAAILTASFPLVIEYSRHFMLDLPLMSMVALFMFFLLRSDNFKRVGFSLVMGVVLGLGMLTKWTFALFIVVPLAVSCWNGLSSQPGRRKKLLTILASGLFALIVSGPWYLRHIVQIIMSRGGELGRGDLGILQSVFFYLMEIPGETSWIVFVILLIGIVSSFLRERKSGSLLWIWFLSAYVLISIVSFKTPRFALPVLLPVTILGSSGLTTLISRLFKNRPGGNVAWACLIALVVVQLLLVQFVPSTSPLGRSLATRVLGTPLLSVHGATGENWDIARVLWLIVHDMQNSAKDRAVVRVIPDHPNLNNPSAAYYALLHRLPLRIAGTSGFPMFTDYVVLKSAIMGLDSPERHRERLTNEILRSAGSDSAAYRVLDSLGLPDGTKAIIVKVVPARDPAASSGRILMDVRNAADRWINRYFRPLGGFSLDVVEYDTAQTSRGRLKSIEMRIEKAECGDFEFNDRGVPVSGVDVAIHDVVFDPRSAVKNHNLEIFSIQGLSVRGICIKTSDILAYFSRAPVQGLKVTEVSMTGGTMAVKGNITRHDLAIEIKVGLTSVANRNIRFKIQQVRIGVVSLPVTPLNVLTDAYNPVLRGLLSVEEVNLGRMALENDELRIEAD